MNEIGIAGWAFNRSIRQDKTMTLLDLPKVCKELGASTIELVSTFFESQSAPYLNQVRDAVEAQGQRVRNIAVDTGNIANADAKARRTDLEAIKQWIHVARAVGSEAIRVNSGAASPDDREAVARITEGYKELAAECEREGVRLLIENHGGASADPKNIKAFLDGVGSSWFLTCPDTSNFPGDTWEEGMLVMAPYAYSCHVKTWNLDPSGKQTRTGRDGQPQSHDLRRCLQILKDANYQGPYNVEYGPTQDEIPSTKEAIAYLRTLLASMG